MKLYVIYEPNKKSVHKFLRDSGYKVNVLSWSDLLALQNKKVKKKDHMTDEIFSTQFDTCLTSSKGNPGLKQCIFVISEDDIHDIISEKFNLLETNPWT